MLPIKVSTTLLRLICPLVACLQYFQSSLFSFQGAGFQPHFDQGQIEALSIPLNASIHSSSGGDSRARTDDPLLAKQVLSQLSYTPSSSRTAFIRNRLRRCSFTSPRPSPRKTMVGLGGLEPPTSRLSVVRSSQLSYRPILKRVPSKLNNVISKRL